MFLIAQRYLLKMNLEINGIKKKSNLTNNFCIQYCSKTFHCFQCFFLALQHFTTSHSNVYEKEIQITFDIYEQFITINFHTNKKLKNFEIIYELSDVKNHVGRRERKTDQRTAWSP